MKYEKKNHKESKKFDQIKIELFFIKTTKKLVNYEFNLLQNVKVFSKFHILLLKLIDLKTFILKTFHFNEIIVVVLSISF